MTVCEVHWRPSGGRGEFEFVPADTLVDRDIVLDLDALNARVQTEVFGKIAQGKPRLRRTEPNNRSKLHLPQLVMAIAGLPEPAREDKHQLSFPLENKSFVIDKMDFDVIEDDGLVAVLSPLRVSVLHSDFEVQLDDRLRAFNDDLAAIERVRARSPELAQAIEKHAFWIQKGENTAELRITANEIIALKSEMFGFTNSASASSLVEAEQLMEVQEEEYVGREGRILTRIHSYRERDRRLVRRAKDHYRRVNGGKLVCASCGMVGEDKYGLNGEACIEAHHKTPVEELQPDSRTTTEDLAMVCASCHRVIHSKTPCFTIEELKSIIA